MISIYGISAAWVAASASLGALEQEFLPSPEAKPYSKRCPHSSTRQNERFARQLAAGKITFQDGSHLSEATRKG